MHQFCEVIAKVVVGLVKPLNNGLQLVCYVNKLDKEGNFTKREIVHVTLFNAAEKSALKRCIKVGDCLYIRNGDYNTYTTPNNVMYVSVVCNYANQIDVVANESHDILDARKMSEV